MFSPSGKLQRAINGELHELDLTERAQNAWIIFSRPREIDGFALESCYGGFAAYRKNHDVRVYSLHRGELVATYYLDRLFSHITFVSNHGQVIEAEQSTTLYATEVPCVLMEAEAGIPREYTGHRPRSHKFSPDGAYLAILTPAERPDWLVKWLPPEKSKTVRVTHWTTNRELASFNRARDAVFSPRGNLLAVVRDDSAIDVYEFPFRTPWGTMAIAALSAAACSWCVGCLWSRWRRRKAIATTTSA